MFSENVLNDICKNDGRFAFGKGKGAISLITRYALSWRVLFQPHGMAAQRVPVCLDLEMMSNGWMETLTEKPCIKDGRKWISVDVTPHT